VKLEITKDWCIRMAQIEGDAEIGAGLLARDPIMPHAYVPDAMAMGDCAVCGHVASDEIHKL
jgi:HTH-type transcriptional regulator, competence development regulator